MEKLKLSEVQRVLIAYSLLNKVWEDTDKFDEPGKGFAMLDFQEAMGQLSELVESWKKESQEGRSPIEKMVDDAVNIKR